MFLVPTVTDCHCTQRKCNSYMRYRSNGMYSSKLEIGHWLSYVSQISANKVPDNTAWSFGQTLPIIMLIGPICDVWDDNYPLVKAAWLKRRAARNSRHPQGPSRGSYASHSSHGSYAKRSGPYFAVEG